MWKRWEIFPEVTEAFAAISSPLQAIPEHVFSLLQRYTVLSYSATSELHLVDEARKELFCTYNRTMLNIPPTEDALRQHVNRSCLQGGQTWGQATTAMNNAPSITEWGWVTVDGKTVSKWTTIPEVSKSIQELIKCNCTKGCKTSACGCKENG